MAFGRGYEFRNTPEFAAKERERDAAEPERFDMTSKNREKTKELLLLKRNSGTMSFYQNRNIDHMLTKLYQFGVATPML